MNTHPVSSIY